MDYDRRRQERFWSQVSIGNEDECWIWTGKIDKDGYGFFWNPTPKIQRSHRYIFYKVNGYLPEVVRHTCDNPKCNNPRHLLGGTQADNNRDTVARGRHKYNPNLRSMYSINGKLTEQQVLDIYQDTRSNAELGRIYGVSRESIRDIKLGYTWSWLTSSEAKRLQDG